MNMHKQLREVGKLLELDCGDSSCMFTQGGGGMRTNGGCNCDLVAAVVKERAMTLLWRAKASALLDELDRCGEGDDP